MTADDKQRPSEDSHSRMMGETTGNRRQPSAINRTAEDELTAGRGEPGAGGSPASRRIEARQEEQAREEKPSG